jgi:hypothetical protein
MALSNSKSKRDDDRYRSPWQCTSSFDLALAGEARRAGPDAGYRIVMFGLHEKASSAPPARRRHDRPAKEQCQPGRPAGSKVEQLKKSDGRYRRADESDA